MNSIEGLDLKEKIIKYGKYVFILIIILFLFLVFKGCNEESNATIEKDVIKAAEKYVKENNIIVTSETYIELSKLEKVDGTELCSKASGVIVKNNNGSLEYTPYLKCKDYESKIIDNKNKIIKLNGDEVLILNVNEAFIDPLYELIEDADVIISGTVGQNAGVYNITYKAYINDELKETAIRKVIRITGDKTDTISGITDVDIPVLTLKGDTEITLYKGERFEEPSWTAYDYTDGVLNTKVKRTITYNNKTVNRVDTSKTGIYRILYSVTNSKGNTAYKSRIINVIEKSLDLKVNLSSNTNEIASSATITINITGKDYAYMYLPSGEKTTERTRTITVKENRTYAFNVYDQYGTRYDKEIEISNLDNIPPTGSCKAKVGTVTTIVDVEATDNKGITGYSYVLDGNESDFMASTQYSVSQVSSNVDVKVKDLAGNVATLSCTVDKTFEYKEPTTLISCKGDRTLYNQQIEQIVATYGKRKRETAVALARYLSTEIGVKIPYFWPGGHWHYSWDGHDDPEKFRGVSPKWGCDDYQYRDYMGTKVHPAGLDCTGFIAWVWFNAGFTKGQVGSFSGKEPLYDAGTKGRKITVIDFKGSAGKIKAGDIVWMEGHMGFVIEVDGNDALVAHERLGYGLVVNKFSLKTGAEYKGHLIFQKVMLMDNYYY